jgi:hypothetical protein
MINLNDLIKDLDIGQLHELKQLCRQRAADLHDSSRQALIEEFQAKANALGLDLTDLIGIGGKRGRPRRNGHANKHSAE